MGRPQSHRREDFVRAALAIVDAEGLEALTFRRLGREVGSSATAAYTHFENRDQLIGFLVNELLREAVNSLSFKGRTPHEKLMEVGQSIRALFLKHPFWISAFLTVGTEAEEESARAFRIVVSLLEEAGLSGEELVLAYRILESFMFGMTAYDLGRAPEQNTVRRSRYKRTQLQAFVDVARSDRSIARHTEEAFEVALSNLLTSLGV